MRFAYDPEVDILMVHLAEVKPGDTVAKTMEVSPGVVLDFDVGGAPVEIEILNAEKRYGKAALEPHDITTNLLSLAEAANRCGLSSGTLKLQAQAGRLKARKVGRNWVTTEAWLRSYLQSRRYNAKDTAVM